MQVPLSLLKCTSVSVSAKVDTHRQRGRSPRAVFAKYLSLKRKSYFSEKISFCQKNLVFFRKTIVFFLKKTVLGLRPGIGPVRGTICLGGTQELGS